MDLTAYPIKVAQPTGDTLYRGDETFVLEAGRKLIIKDRDGGDGTERFKETVPAGKKWSVRLLLEITETDA